MSAGRPFARRHGLGKLFETALAEAAERAELTDPSTDLRSFSFRSPVGVIGRNGRACHPMIHVIQDVRSKKLLSVIADDDENRDNAAGGTR